VLLAASIWALAELASRAALQPAAAVLDYWDLTAGQKYEHFLDLVRQGRSPGVVVVGDSTAARNLDPSILARELGVGGGGYNLAWPANYPMAMACTTMPLLGARGLSPAVLVYSASPGSFVDDPDVVRFEEGILSSPVCRQRLGPPSLLGSLYLPRVLASWDYRRSWWTGEGLRAAPQLAGFMPLDGVSPDRRPLTGTVEGWEHVRVAFEQRRLDVVWQLARRARQLGTPLFVVVPPIAPRDPAIKARHVRYWEALEQRRLELGFRVLAYGDLSLPLSDYWDCFHLRREGAASFSAQVAADIRRELPSSPIGEPSLPGGS
jgi:hypothetical protein